MNQRFAIIMGATSGIGLEVAKALASQGWTVGIAGRRQELLQQLQKLPYGERKRLLRLFLAMVKEELRAMRN